MLASGANFPTSSWSSWREGGTLALEIAAGRLAPRRAVRVVSEVAQALEHAHAQGVLHLDLKPGNVHVGHYGTVKLLDFGVGSKRLRLADGRELPATSSLDPERTVVGTPCYMAPEQWNLQPVDERTDVWSLGMLFYECLTGTLPGDGQHPGFALTSGGSFAVPSLAQKLGLPGAFDRVVERALAVDPGCRFQTVHEVLGMLRILERVLMDADAAELSWPERLLTGAAELVESGFDAQQFHVMTGLAMPLVHARLSELVHRGVLRAFRSGPTIRYRASDPGLSRSCFDQLPLEQRMLVLERLFVRLPR